MKERSNERKPRRKESRSRMEGQGVSEGVRKDAQLREEGVGENSRREMKGKAI